ncbi:MAG: hypothetical protein V4733_04140, partial [Verrucomicrobiota bacterium]
RVPHPHPITAIHFGNGSKRCYGIKKDMIKHLILASVLLTSSCSDRRDSKADIPRLLEAVQCERRSVVGDMQRVMDTEAKDRENYKPLSAETVPIRMREPAKGYHGPTKGSYIFIVERYSTEQEAKRRAEEYTGAGWAKRLSAADDLELLYKSSIRCWAISDDTHVYLLTSQAAMFSALEELTQGIRTKLTKHLHESQTQH